MATKNPRVSVMLTPSSDAILSRLAKASKKSKSGIVAEFLEDTCMPMFERMAIVLEAAATATDEAKSATRQGFAEAEEKLLSVAGLTMDLFDQASKPMLESAERISRRSSTGRALSGGRAAAHGEGAERAQRPPHVTRGSGTPKSTVKTAKLPMKVGSDEVSPQKPALKASKRPGTASKPKTKG